MVSGGIIAIAAGRILTLCVERRRFYRRNAVGVEEFRNFRSVVITRMVERLVVLLGRLLFVGGIASLAWQCFTWTPASSPWVMERFGQPRATAEREAERYGGAPIVERRPQREGDLTDRKMTNQAH